MTVSYLLNGIRFEWDSRKAATNLRNHGIMKINDLKKRLQKDRPKTTISFNLPDDVIADLQRIAPLRGCSNYHALIRAYVGQGLCADLERFEENPELAVFITK